MHASDARMCHLYWSTGRGAYGERSGANALNRPDRGTCLQLVQCGCCDSAGVQMPCKPSLGRFMEDRRMYSFASWPVPSMLIICSCVYTVTVR